MYTLLVRKIQTLADKSAPAIGIGLFRALYGLVALQEIIFLLYFNHLIFDPIPYLEVEFPMIPFFLGLWGIAAFCLCIGYHCQWAAIASYFFWIIFVQFTPMQRDFDGGFDLFMTGAGLMLLFMPMDQALALDGLRRKLRTPFVHIDNSPVQVSALAYLIPVSICLGFLYFDSAIHKLFAPHWRNGLGAWLPATQPYYVSPLDLSTWLNCEWLQKSIGYLILIFQFSFPFLAHKRKLRAGYLLLGIGLHLGIAITLNIYPFGVGMLVFYVLLVPFSWWDWLAKHCQAPQASLVIFFDENCPLCNRTALIVKHFDVFNRLAFKGVQQHARQYEALNALSDQTLLYDLYALDIQGQVTNGVATYSQILIHMRYLAAVGWLLRMPPIINIANYIYRRIADNRQRLSCDSQCERPQTTAESLSWYSWSIARFRAQPRQFAHKLSKIVLILFVLQLNSTLHYGIIYRLKLDLHQNALMMSLQEASNALLLVTEAFTGITPHALYLHDHFSGYDHILAITYLDTKGTEQWLPFIDVTGRMLAPNWGRVHSMWANIAVTPTINLNRLQKCTQKVTAFYAQKLNLNLNNTQFVIKLKKIQAPNDWIFDLRAQNLSGNWQTIGTANWHDQQFSLNVPHNINDL